MERRGSISGHTQLATVIGDPVRHSMSPAIHNAAFAATGFDAVYLATPVPPGEARAAVDSMRRFGWLGMSVTMPHKADVLAACDVVAETAQALGAGNCIHWVDGVVGGAVRADNTDGEGFVRGLATELSVEAAGLKVAMVGAGGAARAVVRALADSGAAQIVVVNRNTDRAAEAVSHAAGIARVGSHDDLSDADVVINGTPLGMAGAGFHDAVPFDVEVLRDDAVVSDLIYHPAETPLLRAAAGRGLRHQNGLAMLVFQAAVAFEHWTGIDAPVAAMQAAVVDALAS
ncbi:MAG: shikimate dehydrogenase [Actinomycetota bacterium]